MKKIIRKSLRRQKRNFENLSGMLIGFDYNQIRLQHEQYMQNLMATNQRLLKDFNIDNNNIILF